VLSQCQSKSEKALRGEEKVMSWRMRKILMMIGLTWILSISIGLVAIAYAGGLRGIGLLGVWFLFSSGMVIILAQLIPMVILLSSFIGTVSSSHRKHEVPIPVR